MAHTKWLASLAFASTLTFPVVATAHSDAHADGKKKAATVAEQKAWGIAGDPRKVTRTIKIDMRDKMEYLPSIITVKEGETVRFEVKNSGRIMHEFVLGTKAELDEHHALMKKFPEMEHDEPYMAHVAPGKTQSVVWRFNRAGEFYFACLMPGHFEAGMIGKVVVKS